MTHFSSTTGYIISASERTSGQALKSTYSKGSRPLNLRVDLGMHSM
jgi:hypothetical protein